MKAFVVVLPCLSLFCVFFLINKSSYSEESCNPLFHVRVWCIRAGKMSVGFALPNIVHDSVIDLLKDVSCYSRCTRPQWTHIDDLLLTHKTTRGTTILKKVNHLMFEVHNDNGHFSMQCGCGRSSCKRSPEKTEEAKAFHGQVMDRLVSFLIECDPGLPILLKRSSDTFWDLRSTPAIVTAVIKQTGCTYVMHRQELRLTFGYLIYIDFGTDDPMFLDTLFHHYFGEDILNGKTAEIPSFWQDVIGHAARPYWGPEEVRRACSRVKSLLTRYVQNDGTGIAIVGGQWDVKLMTAAHRWNHFHELGCQILLDLAKAIGDQEKQVLLYQRELTPMIASVLFDALAVHQLYSLIVSFVLKQ